jgi:hypothetical protein
MLGVGGQRPCAVRTFVRLARQLGDDVADHPAHVFVTFDD